MPHMTDQKYLMSIRASYGEMFIKMLISGNTTTCVLKFVSDKLNEHPVVITQFFILNVLVI